MRTRGGIDTEGDGARGRVDGVGLKAVVCMHRFLFVGIRVVVFARTDILCYVSPSCRNLT